MKWILEGNLGCNWSCQLIPDLYPSSHIPALTRTHMYTVKHTDMPPYDVTVGRRFADLSTEPWSCSQTLGYGVAVPRRLAAAGKVKPKSCSMEGPEEREPILKRRPASLFHSCRVFSCEWSSFLFILSYFIVQLLSGKMQHKQKCKQTHTPSHILVMNCSTCTECWTEKRGDTVFFSAAQT